MTWPPRAKSLLVGCLLIAGAGCGESAMPSVEASATTVTVLVSYFAGGLLNPDGWSMEYDAACGSDETEIVTTEGALVRAGDFELDDEGSTAIFRGPIELVPGPCVIQFRLRDSEEEVIFTLSEPFEIEPRPQPELYVIMADGGCPEIPLPDAAPVPKRFCGPVGGLVLSAETIAAAATIKSVHYLLTTTGDAFLDGPTSAIFEGMLEQTGFATVDLGAGAVETRVWESVGGVYPAGIAMAVELTAVDGEGVAVCTAQTTLDIIPNGIAQAHVIIPCEG